MPNVAKTAMLVRISSNQAQSVATECAKWRNTDSGTSCMAERIGGCGFGPWPRQTKGVKIGTGCFLAWHSALRGYNQNWLARCPSIVTGWCIRVLCLRHGAIVLVALKTRALSHLMQQAATVVIWLKDCWKRRKTPTHTHTHTHTHTLSFTFSFSLSSSLSLIHVYLIQ